MRSCFQLMWKSTEDLEGVMPGGKDQRIDYLSYWGMEYIVVKTWIFREA